MATKKYIALARVSTREQEREGFSLDVQVEALNRWAVQHRGEVVRMWRIAETASKIELRTAFKEFIAYAKQHATELDGMLFYKVDRAARNLKDYLALEELESNYNLPFISTSQPTENTPQGRLQRRIFASIAITFPEQLALDVKEGMARRVQEGWFPCSPPYGYCCVRREGRSFVEIHTIKGPTVSRIFRLFADHQLPVESLIVRLSDEGITFRDTRACFPRSTLYKILHDRSYIGEIYYQGQWHKGKHEALVDRATWDRAQNLLRSKMSRAHDLTFAGKLITCGHCGKFITGEQVTKKTTGKTYIYYRCCEYSRPGHPRIRLAEAEVDRQFLAAFDRLKIEDDNVRAWFMDVLRARSQEARDEAKSRATDLQRQLTQLQNQQSELLNLRLSKEIDAETFAAKSTEIRDREARLQLLLEACGQEKGENAEIARKAIELAQMCRNTWILADCRKKKFLVSAVVLNSRLDGASLVVTMRKPFDVLANWSKTLESRGDRTPVELFAQAVGELSPEVQELILSGVARSPATRQFQPPRRLRGHAAGEPEVQVAA